MSKKKNNSVVAVIKEALPRWSRPASWDVEDEKTFSSTYKGSWQRELDYINQSEVSDKWSAGQNYASRWYGTGYSYSWGGTYTKNSIQEWYRACMNEAARVVKLALPNELAVKAVIKMGGADGQSMSGLMVDDMEHGHIAAHLEPSWVSTIHSDTSDDPVPPAITDAYCGEALCQTAMHGTADKGQINGALHTDISFNNNDLKVPFYLALERSVATKTLLHEWPGFAPYLKRAVQQNGLANSAEVEEFCATHGPKADSIISAAGFMLNNPGAALGVNDEVMEPAVRLLDSLVNTMKESRFTDAAKAVSDVVAKYGRIENPMPKPPPQMTPMLGCISVHQGTDDNAVEIKDFDPNRAVIPSGCRDVPVMPPTIITGDKKKYDSLVSRFQPWIRRLKRSLSFKSDAIAMAVYGCRSGDMDEGAVHELVNVRDDDPAIWERREERSTANVAIGILVDESGSMDGTVWSEDPGTGSFRQHKYEQARAAAVVLSEAFKGIPGVSLCVFGHTTDYSPGSRNEAVVIHEYLSRKTDTPHGIAGIYSHNANADGFAMEYVAKRMSKDYRESDRRYLFVISDGHPACNGYGDAPAREHMKRVVENASVTLGVEIYSLGVEIAKSRAEDMYGPNRFVPMNNIMQSLPILEAFFKKIFRK